MIYRTSQRGTYRNINNSLNLLSYRIGELSAKIASEKSINKPSDNPSGAAKVLRTRTVLAEIAQNTANVNHSNTWLTNTGNLMDSVKSSLDEIYTKAEQGATDTYTAEQRLIIAEEIDALFKSVIQFSDGQYGGNYLLSGLGLNVQPFTVDPMAQRVAEGCDNSEKWTGSVVNAGDLEFDPRPDLPVQSQKFLIEVVQAGGVDSKLYAGQTDLASMRINGSNALGGYALSITSKDQAYNGATVRLAAGPENRASTGTPGGADEVAYSFSGSGPVSVAYVYGDAATPTTASWSAADRTMTVRLQTDGLSPPSSSPFVTAQVVAAAVNAAAAGPPAAGLTAAAGGTGRVDLERGQGGLARNTLISFNHGTTVSVDGDAITVWLERSNWPDDSIAATAADVAGAINADPAASKMVSAAATGDGALGVAETLGSPMSMTPTDPYTLAWTLAEVPGDHNDLVFSVDNLPGAPKGEAGNQYSVRYEWPDPPGLAAATTARYEAASAMVVVTLGSSGAVFMDEYARSYADPASSGYRDNAEAIRLARLKSNTATAADVAAAVEALSQAENLHIAAAPADGDSGLGLVTPNGTFQFQDGYDQPALMRVSQDGGLTWGPPTAFSASEFQAGGLYYNSQLGHASMTTSLPGAANDLVFTANHMGTWGDDVRVEYRMPGGAAPSDPEVSVGPQPWNICVTLGVDSQGRVNTTADDVMRLVNSHPEAGQLVTASLANYHEGGGGVVAVMDCVPLSTGEPYEIDGRTRITALGHATAAVAFPYEPPEQSSPDLIFQALEHGAAGNSVGVRYTLSADTTIYGEGALYQDEVSIEYQKDDHGRQVVVVHLASSELPSCPDPETEREAYDQFRDLYPLYSCTSSRAVLSTAGDVLAALVDKNLSDPDQALVWASMEYKDEGWDSTAKVGPTTSTVWLSGGDDALKASDHGVGLKFIPDGTALQVGDVFEVGVGWYNGDSGDLQIDSMTGYRTTTNVTGDALLGANGASDNVLDTINRLHWALTHDDTELVGRELPKLKAALEKITTMETNVGTKIIRNQFVLNNLELNKYASETILSETEDADFTRLITDLKNSQTVYEAVLGTTGLTTKLSLLNYI